MRRPTRIVIAILLAVAAIFGGRIVMWLGSRGLDTDSLRPGHRVAIIFGAGLSTDGAPSPLLTDRILAGERLLRRGIVDRLLMSGDNSVPEHDEPTAMRRRAIKDGIAPDLIAVDYGGRRTWDSCVRARTVFEIEHAVLVTSDFHRDRTVAICRAAGLTVDGAVGSSTSAYGRSSQLGWRLRELGASWRGVYDALINRPDAAVGGDPIDIYDPAELERSLGPTARPTRDSGRG